MDLTYRLHICLQYRPPTPNTSSRVMDDLLRTLDFFSIGIPSGTKSDLEYKLSKMTSFGVKSDKTNSFTDPHAEHGAYYRANGTRARFLYTHLFGSLTSEKDLPHFAKRMATGVDALCEHAYGMSGPGNWLENLNLPSRSVMNITFSVRRDIDDGFLCISNIKPYREEEKSLLGLPGLGWVEQKEGGADIYNDAIVGNIKTMFGISWPGNRPPIQWTDEDRNRVAFDMLKGPGQEYGNAR